MYQDLRDAILRMDAELDEQNAALVACQAEAEELAADRDNLLEACRVAKLVIIRSAQDTLWAENSQTLVDMLTEVMGNR